MPDAESLRTEVIATLESYVAAFERGTRDDLQAFCKLPVAYVTDDEVQLRERYPFDPVKLREVTGIARSNVTIDVVHVDGHKAHVLINGTRCRADGSVVERIGAVYLLHRVAASWKISVISGVRSDPVPDRARG